jgi:SNF2 family DNA or RNA helicase
MRLDWNGHNFIARLADKSEHAKARKLGFEKLGPAWTTQSLKVAAQLRDKATDSARVILNRYLIEESPWLGRIQWPEGKTPLSFQLPATEFSLDRNRSYLALDPGLGKGVITALIANALEDWLVTIVCPPYLIYNVESELRAWDVHEAQYRDSHSARPDARGLPNPHRP